MDKRTTGNRLIKQSNITSTVILPLVCCTFMLLSCTLDSSSPYETNKSPRIYSIVFSPRDTVEVNDSLDITCDVEDAEDDLLTFNWFCSTGKFDTSLTETNRARWIADFNTGITEITLQVSDKWHVTEAMDTVYVLPVGGLNYPPVILGITPAQDSVEVLDTLSIVCYVDDPDDPVDSLKIEWFADEGEILIETGIRTYWKAPSVTGVYKIRVEVSDSFATTHGDINARVVPTGSMNDPPIITSLTANPTEISAGDTTFITCIATDPEKDTLIYSWDVDEGYIIGSGRQVYWISPAVPGDYKVHVTVSDAHSSVSDSVEVRVIPVQIILLERDFSTDQVSGEWLYIGKLKGLGEDDGPHSISWDAVNQAMSVIGRANYATFGFQLQNRTFDDGTFSIQCLAQNTQYGRIAFLPKFIDIENWFMVSINLYQQSWQVIRSVDGVVQYLAEGWGEFVPDRQYMFTYRKTDNHVVVKIDDEEIWTGVSTVELNDALPLGVAVYGLMDSEPALFDNLIVTNP